MPNGDSTEQLQKNVETSSFWNSGVYYLILALFFLSLLGGIFYFVYPRVYPRLVVSNQKVGESVFLERASLAKPGWVVVKMSNKFNKPGLVIGESAYLLPGNYEDFHIEFEPIEVLVAEGVIDESYRDFGFTKGQKVYVQILEDADKAFGEGIDSEADEAAMNLFGDRVETQITFE